MWKIYFVIFFLVYKILFDIFFTPSKILQLFIFVFWYFSDTCHHRIRKIPKTFTNSKCKVLRQDRFLLVTYDNFYIKNVTIEQESTQCKRTNYKQLEKIIREVLSRFNSFKVFPLFDIKFTFFCVS